MPHAKGSGPDFLGGRNFPISFWNTIKVTEENKTPTAKGPNLAAPPTSQPFAQRWEILPTAFWRPVGRLKKEVGSTSWGSNRRWLLIDTWLVVSNIFYVHPYYSYSDWYFSDGLKPPTSYSLLVVSNTCMQISFMTQIDSLICESLPIWAQNLGAWTSDPMTRTCGVRKFGELQQSCSSMVEIVAWSAECWNLGR